MKFQLAILFLRGPKAARFCADLPSDQRNGRPSNTKRIPNEPSNFFRTTKKELIQAMRDERQTDPQGREIRKMIAIRIKGEKVQKSLWFELYEAKPQRVHVALSQQRRGIVAYCRKHKQTVESYNDNNKYGAHLPLFDYNINKNLKESQLPTEYPDAPPDGEY